MSKLATSRMLKVKYFGFIFIEDLIRVDTIKYYIYYSDTLNDSNGIVYLNLY